MKGIVRRWSANFRWHKHWVTPELAAQMFLFHASLADKVGKNGGIEGIRLIGDPGAGKSSLAETYAQIVAQSHPQGVFVIYVAMHHEMTPDELAYDPLLVDTKFFGNDSLISGDDFQPGYFHQMGFLEQMFYAAHKGFHVVAIADEWDKLGMSNAIESSIVTVLSRGRLSLKQGKPPAKAVSSNIAFFMCMNEAEIQEAMRRRVHTVRIPALSVAAQMDILTGKWPKRRPTRVNLNPDPIDPTRLPKPLHRFFVERVHRPLEAMKKRKGEYHPVYNVPIPTIIAMEKAAVRLHRMGKDRLIPKILPTWIGTDAEEIACVMEILGEDTFTRNIARVLR